MSSTNIIVHIAIFSSGTGSNAKKIIEHFHNSEKISVSLLVCNKPGAQVIKIAESNGIPVLITERNKFFTEDAYLPELKNHNIDFIVLAGFLWKIPLTLIEAYPDKIINIHPALLPKYGGKNMYGNYVHEAVINSGDKETGITIHYVDDQYDNGKIIFQQKCTIDENETPETLAGKVHALEHKNYPLIIEKVIKKEFEKLSN